LTTLLYRIGGGFHAGGQGDQLVQQVWPLGDAEERAPGAAVARAAGEEAAQPDPPPRLPTLPHHGDQPQTAHQPAARRPGVHVRAPARRLCQPAEDVQHYPCHKNVQGRWC